MTEIQAKVFRGAPSQRIVRHRLLKTRGYCPTGSRYITRANMLKLFSGETCHAIVRNDGSQRYPKQARSVRAQITGTRLRIGCHV